MKAPPYNPTGRVQALQPIHKVLGSDLVSVLPWLVLN
jgi:hypothetical protein